MPTFWIVVSGLWRHAELFGVTANTRSVDTFAAGAQVSVAGSVSVDRLMEIERYSHVMHISSTVTGQLLPELGVWDVLRAALPAGTVSGAPKARPPQPASSACACPCSCTLACRAATLLHITTQSLEPLVSLCWCQSSPPCTQHGFAALLLVPCAVPGLALPSIDDLVPRVLLCKCSLAQSGAR